MTLADRLKLARKHAKLSQPQLQELSGVPQQTISNIERGIQDKSTDIVPLAIACGVRPEWLAMERGDMTDGMNEKIRIAVTLMQEMPEYALDEAIKSVDTVAKLTRYNKKDAAQ
jgi:transcriptional regulator with XRE-family HTH domain